MVCNHNDVLCPRWHVCCTITSVNDVDLYAALVARLRAAMDAQDWPTVYAIQLDIEQLKARYGGYPPRS